MPENTTVTIAQIEAAQKAIAAYVPVTPLTFSPALSEISGHKVYLKWDNKLRTGSFKERGAVSVLTRLREHERMRGVCAASAGNHALALSFHAARLSIACTIVMPTNAPLVKVQSTINTGAQVLLHGATFDDAYEYAVQLANEKSFVYVPAFDDEKVIAGQGTAGLEILNQIADFDAVIVPIGGGGLISGIATAIKAKRPDVFLLGVQSEWAVQSRLAQKKNASEIIFPTATIADGIAVKRPGKITEPIIQKLVNERVSVSEQEIAHAIIRLLEIEKTVVEGAGAAGVAALLANKIDKKLKRCVIMICGSNIDMSLLSRLLERDMGESGRLLKLGVSVPDKPGSLHTTTGILAAAGANVLQVLHNRSFSQNPGNVEITFELEVKNREHSESIITKLKQAGIGVQALL